MAGMGAPRLVGSRQMLELDAEHRSLNSIHPAIPTEQHMMIFPRLAVIAQHLNLVLQLNAAGNHRSGLPKGTQVLARVKAEATCNSKGTRFPALVFGPVRLTGVFDDWQAVSGRNFENRVHIGHLP